MLHRLRLPFLSGEPIFRFCSWSSPLTVTLPRVVSLVRLYNMILFLRGGVTKSLRGFSRPLPFPIRSASSFQVHTLFRPLRSSAHISFRGGGVGSGRISIRRKASLLCVSSLRSSFFKRGQGGPVPRFRGLRVRGRFPLFSIPLPRKVLCVSFMSLCVLSGMPRFRLLPPYRTSVLLL